MYLFAIASPEIGIVFNEEVSALLERPAPADEDESIERLSRLFPRNIHVSELHGAEAICEIMNRRCNA